MAKRVVIVGGGITGLTAAYKLIKGAGDAVEVHLIERSERLGGKTGTELTEGFVIEQGPDSFVGHKPALVNLCKELGIELTGPNPKMKKTYIWSGKRLEPLPVGLQLMIPTEFGPFIKTPLLSWKGKLRAGLEPLIPVRKETGDESIGSFVRRRFGDEMLQGIAGPLMGGIYGGSFDEVSMGAAFPQFMKIEREKGSLLLNALRNKAQAKPKSTTGSAFLTAPQGLQKIVDRLAEEIKGKVKIHLGKAVQSVAPVAPQGVGGCLCKGEAEPVTVESPAHWLITLSTGEALVADALILATPAWVSAELLGGALPEVAEELRDVPYGNSVVVALGYKKDEIGHPLDGTGFLIPARYPMEVTASTWVSSKWEHAAPADRALLRVFLGRGKGKDWTVESDEAVLAEVKKGLHETMGVTAEPFLTRIFRYQRSNPIYRVGHIEQMKALRAKLPTGLYLAGAPYSGVGLPDCVREGQEVAAQVAQALQ